MSLSYDDLAKEDSKKTCETKWKSKNPFQLVFPILS